MNSLNRLRFKVATSFAIAALCAVAFARLASIVPLSLATLAPFLILCILLIAALWRGYIFMRALRGPTRP